MSRGSPLEFPALLSDPLAQMPFPIQSSTLFQPSYRSCVTRLSIYLCLTFFTLSQGYLVSAGPTIATSIPQLHPKLVGPMMSEGESLLLEKGARETLRLLIGSSSGQPSSSLMGVLPAVLTGSRGLSRISDVVTGSRGLYSGISDVVTGSRGLYSGITDVDMLVNGFVAVGLNTVSERSGIVTSRSTAPSSDASEQTSYGMDLQNSAFTSGKD